MRAFDEVLNAVADLDGLELAEAWMEECKRQAATISKLQAEIARLREAWEPLVQQAAHVELGLACPVDVQGATEELIRIISGFDALMSARAALGGSND